MNISPEKLFTALLSHFLTLFSGCSPAVSQDVEPTPDIDATVHAALGATQIVEANLQSTVESAVSVTFTAMPSPTPIIAESLSEEAFAEPVAARVSTRAAEIGNLEPDQIAANRFEALSFAPEDINEARSALADGVVSPDELLNLAQRGANASASLDQYGLGELGNLSVNIQGLTGQLAAGQVENALNTLNDLESMLPNR